MQLVFGPYESSLHTGYYTHYSPLTTQPSDGAGMRYRPVSKATIMCELVGWE